MYTSECLNAVIYTHSIIRGAWEFCLGEDRAIYRVMGFVVEQLYRFQIEIECEIFDTKKSLNKNAFVVFCYIHI